MKVTKSITKTVLSSRLVLPILKSDNNLRESLDKAESTWQNRSRVRKPLVYQPSVMKILERDNPVN